MEKILKRISENKCPIVTSEISPGAGRTADINELSDNLQLRPKKTGL
jgi:hypothetical protein